MSSLSSVRVVGGLLPGDVVGAVLAGTVEGLKGSDYHLGSESPREAAARSWTHLRAAYGRFREELSRLPEGDPAVAVTRERWLGIVLADLGYGRVSATPAGGLSAGEGSAVKQYPVSHLWGCTPVHQLGWGVDLDRRSPGVAGAARAPHAMVQELLNRTDEYLWAILSNGRTLRLLRDSTTLTGFAYVEFDLESMFDGDLFSEFALLFLLAHQSRVEVAEGSAPSTCWLERWRTTAIGQGVRALTLLRSGVEAALGTLGTGFLTHPANSALRDSLADGTVRLSDVHAALLRTVYRLLFWAVVEDRDALLTPNATSEQRARYRDYFSSARLRDLALKRHGTGHDDLWQGATLVLDALGRSSGEARLGLSGLGGLFTCTAADVLAGCRLSNTALLTTIRSLSVVQPKGEPRRVVDFAHLGAEELGSVYESLLELVPRYDPVSHAFSLQTLAGNDRKTSGSYYTPSELVELVLDTALDPVLDDVEKRTKTPEARAAALLNLKVCDPAVGSAHFLVAAARRIALRLAVARTGELDPTPTDYSDALHDVVGSCLYGVDLNPMAADLAKVSLWLTAMTPGKPLSFLDHHIKVGNALLGTTPALLHDGIPDAAFTALTTDDKAVVARWKKANKTERANRDQASLFAEDQPALDWRRGAEVEYEIRSRLESRETVADVAWAEERYRQSADEPEGKRGRAAADTWCGAFVGPRDDLGSVLTDGTIADLLGGAAEIESVATLLAALTPRRLFHWHLEFPDVLSLGGFDLIVGNPPFLSPLRSGASVSPARLLVRSRFDGLGGPKADESSYFTLLADSLVKPQGRIGLVLPDSFLSASDSAEIRRRLVERHDLTDIWRGDGSEFEAAVTTIAIALGPKTDSPALPVRRVGPTFRRLPDVELDWRAGTWAPLVSESLGGLIAAAASLTEKLGDLCEITADYRDQYYGLRGAVHEADSETFSGREMPLLVTTGLIDPLRMSWGSTATKFDKVSYRAPVVDIAKLSPELQRWAASRLRPKILVATQGKMPEAVVDEAGSWIPCVPVLTVFPVEGGLKLDEIAAVLTSPPVYAYLKSTKLGAGLSTSALKVSAADLRGLPAPADRERLRGAVAALQRALDDVAEAPKFARIMNEAYGLGEQDDTAWLEIFGQYRAKALR